MESVEDPHNKGSPLVTSPVPVGHRQEGVGDLTSGDACIVRIAHRAYRLELNGANPLDQRASPNALLANPSKAQSHGRQHRSAAAILPAASHRTMCC